MLEPGVIGQRPPSGAAKLLGELLGAAARGAIDDPALAAMGVEPLDELAGRVGLRPHRQEEVRPVERADEHVWAPHEQLAGDLAPRRRVGRRRHRDRLDGAQRLDHLAQAQIFGAEVVPPLRHAMGFVDGEAADRKALEVGDHVVAQQPFRGDVEQAQRSLPEAARDPAALLGLGRGIEGRGLDAELAKLRHLAAHQRDQRRDHQRQAVPDNRRQLEEERLAAAGRHHRQHVLAVEDRGQDLLLPGPEGGIAVDAGQRRARFRDQRRIGAHALGPGSATGVHWTASTLSAPVASMTRRSKPSAAPHASGIARDGGQKILVDRVRRAVDPPLLGHVGLKPAALLGGVGQLVEGVGELDAAGVELEALGDARVGRIDLRQGGLARRIGGEEGRAADPEMRLDPLAEEPAEDVGPGVVRRHPHARRLRLRGRRGPRPALRRTAMLS